MWIDISENYQVSDVGEIRNTKTKRILHQFVGKDGYLRTQFDGKTRLVHRAVATAFLQNPYNLPEINHLDGNKQNNRIENLEWCDRSHNLKHAYGINLRNAKGENNARAKLTDSDVKYIRSHYIRGDKSHGAKALSKKFGVAHQTICAVVSGQNWS